MKNYVDIIYLLSLNKNLLQPLGGKGGAGSGPGSLHEVLKPV